MGFTQSVYVDRLELGARKCRNVAGRPAHSGVACALQRDVVFKICVMTLLVLECLDFMLVCCVLFVGGALRGWVSYTGDQHDANGSWCVCVGVTNNPASQVCTHRTCHPPPPPPPPVPLSLSLSRSIVFDRSGHTTGGGRCGTVVIAAPCRH